MGWTYTYTSTQPPNSNIGPAKGHFGYNMAYCCYRPLVPPYAIAPDYTSDRPPYLYFPSPIVDYHGYMREAIKQRGAMIIDKTQETGPGPAWEQKWINYVNVINSVNPWRAAGKPFVCDRLWLWTS